MGQNISEHEEDLDKDIALVKKSTPDIKGSKKYKHGRMPNKFCLSYDYCFGSF